MKTITTFILSLLSHLGLGSTPLPVSIFTNIEGEWGDVDLKTVSTVENDDRSLAIEAISVDSNLEYGFRFVLLPDWEFWRPERWPIDSYRGKIRIESLGDPSIRLIKAISKAYDKKIKRIDFSSVELTAISLDGDPRNTLNEQVKLKLFYDSEDEEIYAEAFLNILLDQSLIQFHEKDQDYRTAVLGFLTRKGDANQSVDTTPASAPR